MFKVIKQALIALLSFSGSLAHQAKVSECTECVSLNNESCIARPKLNELNQEELFYYPHMVRLDTVEVVIVLMICQVEYVFWIK